MNDVNDSTGRPDDPLVIKYGRRPDALCSVCGEIFTPSKSSHHNDPVQCIQSLKRELFNVRDVLMRESAAVTKAQTENEALKLSNALHDRALEKERKDRDDWREAHKLLFEANKRCILAIRGFIKHRDSVANHPDPEERLSMTIETLTEFYAILDAHKGIE